jgi:hypothetical protein
MRPMSDNQKQYIERPTPPSGKEGKRLHGFDPSLSGAWLITRGAELVAVYNPFYYLTPEEIVADFVEIIRVQDDWEFGDADYVLWKSTSTRDRYWIRATIRWRPDAGGQRVEFYEVKADRYVAATPWPGWPTREQWIESGRGDLWLIDDALPA